MIKVKANGTDTKEVLEGTIGMTVALTDESVNDLDGYWMYDVKVAYWTDARNVEVVDPSAYYEDEKVIAKINERLEKGEPLW